MRLETKIQSIEALKKQRSTQAEHAQSLNKAKNIYPAPFPNTPQLAAGMKRYKKILSAGFSTPLKGAGFIDSCGLSASKSERIIHKFFRSSVLAFLSS